MTPNKEKRPGGKAEANQGKAEAEKRSYSPKSTASEAQRLRILAALRTGPKTSYDLRRLGAYQAPARIIELRRSGFSIRTEFVTLVDSDGFLHPRAARYHLLDEGVPDGQRTK